MHEAPTGPAASVNPETNAVYRRHLDALTDEWQEYRLLRERHGLDHMYLVDLAAAGYAEHCIQHITRNGYPAGSRCSFRRAQPPVCRECGEQLQGWEAEDFAGPLGARCCARRTGCAHAEVGYLLR